MYPNFKNVNQYFGNFQREKVLISKSIIIFSQGIYRKKELQLFNRINIPIENLLSRDRGGCSIDPESVVLSGYIWTEFVALHHHELEISGQVLLKLLYFKGLYKKNG